MAFKFEFSLSVLRHLGSSLYRNFATVVAEAISNSWDAEATSVHVEMEGDSLIISDNGVGMNEGDLQDKFFNIGYNRRRDPERRHVLTHSVSGRRRVLGRKGIGKLAYLSIANEMIIITKKKDSDMVCVAISKEEIDNAIETEQKPVDWTLRQLAPNQLGNITCKIRESGTQLVFKGLRKNLKKHNIRAILATQFHFSHVMEGDDKFEIFVKDEYDNNNGDGKIGIKDLKDIYSKVQFAWFFSEEAKQKFFDDLAKAGISPGIDNDLGEIETPEGACKDHGIINRVINYSDRIDFPDESMKRKFDDMDGYILSVNKPSSLYINITEKEFKASVALFAGGRMRESELVGGKVSHARLPEHYLFGQIHVDFMDGEDDCFISGREGVMDDDPTYKKFKELLRKILQDDIISDWSKWRPKEIEPNEIEKTTDDIFKIIAKKQGHDLPSEAAEQIQKMARENVPSYINCFIAENLMRYYILKERISYANCQSLGYRQKEETKLGQLGIPFPVKEPLFNTENNDISYLSSGDMASIIDRHNRGSNEQETEQEEFSQETSRERHPNAIGHDDKYQQPLRNAVMHTSLLTNLAKSAGDTGWNTIIYKISNWLRGQRDE